VTINNHKPDEDGLCVDSMLPIAQCAGCMGHTDGEGLPQETFKEMPAKYSGRVDCGHTVREGDTIYLTVESDWICGRCSKQG
jgi:hypothetical protein